MATRRSLGSNSPRDMISRASGAMFWYRMRAYWSELGPIGAFWIRIVLLSAGKTTLVRSRRMVVHMKSRALCRGFALSVKDPEGVMNMSLVGMLDGREDRRTWRGEACGLPIFTTDSGT